MRAADILWAWVAGIAIVSALALAAHLVGTQPRFAGAPIVVVGSSLMLHAVPPDGLGQDSLLGDGRSHRRVGVDSAGEKELLSLARRALDEHASLLLLEVNPLIRDLSAGAKASCSDWVTSVRTTINLERREIARATRLAMGWHAREAGMGEATGLDKHRAPTALQIAHSYPFRLREPTCRRELERVVASARRQGVQVVLVLPPRSRTAHALLGQSQALELERTAQHLADALGTPLFDAGSPWPDQEFVDHAHLGATGRVHFLQVLRLWWQRRA